MKDYNIKQTNICIIQLPKEERERKGQKTYFKN